MWLDPGEKPPKVRLVADTNFPYQLVDELRKGRIEVRTAQELGLDRLPDDQLLREVAKRGMALITRDRDFLSDHKFPVHTSGMVVHLEGDGEGIGNTIGFELLIYFLKIWGTRKSGKIRGTSDSLFLKIQGHEGKNAAYEIKAIRPGLYAREVTRFEEK